MGWHCITIWECSLKKEKRTQTLESLAFTLNHIFLVDHSVHYKALEQEQGDQIAAEPLGGI